MTTAALNIGRTPFVVVEGQHFLLVPMAQEEITDLEMWADEKMTSLGALASQTLRDEAHR